MNTHKIFLTADIETKGTELSDGTHVKSDLPNKKCLVEYARVGDHTVVIGVYVEKIYSQEPYDEDIIGLLSDKSLMTISLSLEAALKENRTGIKGKIIKMFNQVLYINK